MITYADLHEMPKIELHRHVEGAFRPETLFEFWQRENPKSTLSYDEFKLTLQATDGERDLMSFISKLGTKYIRQLKLRPADIKRLVYEVVEDAARDSILYMELRVCPLAHVREDMPLQTFIKSYFSGVRLATKKCDIIVKTIISFKREDEVIENMKLARVVKKIGHRWICGVDLCGNEGKYPNEMYVKLFDYCRKAKFNITIHAGEAAGASSVITAICTLGAQRVGHGVNIFPSPNEVLSVIRDKDVVVEMCPQSNLCTNDITHLENHPIKYLVDRDIMVTVNTDDPTTTNMSLTDELYELHKTFNFSMNDFRRMQLSAIYGAFLNEKEKNLLQYEFGRKFDAFMKQKFFFESDQALVLVLISSLLKEQVISCAIFGSTSLSLQGIKITTNDIDILVDRKDVSLVNDILKSCTQSVMNWKEKKYFSSIFGSFEIHGIKIDVMADFSINDTKYRLKYDLTDPRKRHTLCKWTKVPILPKEYEMVRYLLTERKEKWGYIGSYLRRSKPARADLEVFMKEQGFESLIPSAYSAFNLA